MQNDLRFKIGSQMKALRLEKGITLSDLARLSGVQIATLSRIENGKMTGKLEAHLAIVKALNVPLTDLYIGIM